MSAPDMQAIAQDMAATIASIREKRGASKRAIRPLFFHQTAPTISNERIRAVLLSCIHAIELNLKPEKRDGLNHLDMWMQISHALIAAQKLEKNLT